MSGSELIRIYGAGVSGCFLAHLLSDYNVEVIEPYPDRCPHCAFGWARYDIVKRLHKRIGIDTDEYVYHKIKKVWINGVTLKAKNLRTFDKKRYIQDMREGLNIKNEIPESLTDDAEIVVDATGTKRYIIGKLLLNRETATTPDMKITCVQYNMEGDTEPVMYIYGTKHGYAWAFPLAESWHIGAGSRLGVESTKQLIVKLSLEVPGLHFHPLCKCQAPVLHVDPVYRHRLGDWGLTAGVINDTAVLAVGEAAFCVNGVGEGNTSGIKSAEFVATAIRAAVDLDDPVRVVNEYYAYMRTLWMRIHYTYERTRAIEKGFWAALKAIMKYGSDSIVPSPKALLALWRVTHAEGWVE